ncbi:putative ferric-chelate reductase 1 isoform X2 [Ruditapes philippinarum]|uniref:putative ferric-chelate reductase 1 isoform X2 n=1 Tax=Ruditapes philippinarum TaxID=129788 RepID=UPI00295B8B2C|nr:putative ferric-chelate reductase 1 isoform X2 [Ruditapes philippinarum]
MKSVHLSTIIIYALLCILHHCSSYPTGAPLVACQEMRPYHPPTTTSGTPPFAINLTETVYKPGSEIKGTIYSPKGFLFRGFLIQARKADNSEMTPFGEFIVSGSDTHTNCGNANKQGLTHTSNSNKTEIDFTWKAPMTFQGDLHFKLTIVESYNVSRFWLGIYSSVVKDCSLHPSNECADIPTEQPATISPGPETTSDETISTPASTSPAIPLPSTVPRNNIPNDPECGVSKGCFPDCSNGCEYLVTWHTVFKSNDTHAAAAGDDDEDDYYAEWVHFELRMVLEETDNVWIAVGLSPTGLMDGTNVIACLTGRNTVSVESSHNKGYKNVMYSTKTLGLLAMSGSVHGNLIECSFTRHIAMNVSDFLNLKNEVYLLVGHGPVVKGIKYQHTKIPIRSPGKVNILSRNANITTVQPLTTSPAPQNNIPNDPECGVSKGCFPDCSNGCEYLVTWQVDSNSMDNINNAAADTDGVHFEFKMVLEETDNVWIAIGFSPTGKMDDTNVIACLTGRNNVSVESSHNEGYTNVMYSKKTLGLSNMQGSVKGKKIECSFTRKMSMNVTDFMNLKDEAYLLVGHGPVVNGIKQQHTKIPVRSSGKVDFLSHKVSKESDSASPLIKLHGSLMVVAWVLCSSIGVVIARHFKSMAHGKMMCNVRYWFAIHRTLMFVVLLCVIIAFVAIFYEIGGFSQISADPGKEYTKAHPYLGIIVTCLTLLNPIMALFRPPVDHQHRPIFNWAHFSVGTAAHIIAVVTIFFGINLSKAKVDEYAKDVMIAYSVIFVVAQSVLEIQKKRDVPKDSITYGKLNSNSVKQRLLTTTSNSLTTYKTTSLGVSGNKKEGVSMFSTIVLFLHGVCMVVAATLLILMICDPTHFHLKK